MNNSSASIPRDEDLLLVNAYIDGELDAAAVLDIERRMNENAALKTQYDRLVALRSALIAKVPKDRPSEALRDKIVALTAPAPARAPSSATRVHGRNFDWRQMAASVLIAAMVSSGVTTLASKHGQIDSDVAAVVSGHQRALLATASVDVASSDRHTVKPWFDSKLALSPPVVDLASSGFPLAGGRVEVVSGKPTPVLVYKRHEHLISVVAIPKSDGPVESTLASRYSRDGYIVFAWRGQDFEYFAVSDIAQEELAAFVSSWRAETDKK